MPAVQDPGHYTAPGSPTRRRRQRRRPPPPPVSTVNATLGGAGVAETAAAAAAARRHARQKRYHRHLKQRYELTALNSEIIPDLTRRQLALNSITGTTATQGLIPSAFGPSPSQQHEYAAADVERRLTDARTRAAHLERLINQRRGRRAGRKDPITLLDVATAVGSAIPGVGLPLRGASLAAKGASVAARGGEVAAARATTTATERAAAEAAAETATRGASGVARGTGSLGRPLPAGSMAAARAAGGAATRRGIGETVTDISQRLAARGAVRRATTPGVAGRILRRGPRGGKARLGAAGGAATGATGASAAVLPALAGTASTPEAARIAAAPVQLARATVEDPLGVAGQSLKSLKETFFGIPAAAIESIGAGYDLLIKQDPDKAEDLAGMFIDDLERRYGPLVEGDTAEFRRRVQTEGGLTPFALDALVVIPPASRVGGALARGGRLGARAERFATAERPALRTAAGIVKPQDIPKGLVGTAIARGLDKRRRRASEKRVAAGERRLIEGTEGEVVPARLKGKIAREIATRRGRGFIEMTEEQAHEIARGAAKEVRGLSKAERRGLTNALRFGIRDPETAKPIIGLRLKQIRENREAIGHEGRYNVAKELEWLREHADEVFTPELARVTNRLRRQEKRLAVGDVLGPEKRRRDPGLVVEQAALRRYAQQAELLGVRRNEGETNAEFIARVRQQAKGFRLDEPGYVASELARGRRFAEFALGGGPKGVSHIPKRYKGTLHRLGRESESPEVVIRGLARNIKRRHNWKLVADTFERYAPAWARNDTILNLHQKLQDKEIAEENVAYFNPGRFRKEIDQLARDKGETPDSPGLLDERELRDAVARSTIRGDVDPAEFEKSSGWSLVPREVMDQLEAQIQASGKLFGRTISIATQKSARAVLALNPPWLAFQAVSNAALAGLAGTGPITAAKSALWWRGLPDEVKREISPYVGIGHFKSDVRQDKLGAATRGQAAGVRHFIDAYRGFKASKFGQNMSKANPLDWLFRADNAQNNFFRRAVLYKELNRERYQRMNGTVNALAKSQDRLTSIFKLDPADQLRELSRHPEVLEKAAAQVNDFLGDYTAFTPKERGILKRSVMFYGYLRFSLRFAFYTMPLRHPVMTGIMGNLARLESKELKELLGTDLPFAIGQYYFGDKGQLVVNLARANPVLNAVTQSSGVRQAAGILPPYVGMLASQVFQTDPFTGEPWKVEGSSEELHYNDPGIMNRGRIALDQGLSLFWPYRTAETLAFKGAPQGADSLAFDPRPTEYAAGGEAAQHSAEAVREAERKGVLQTLFEESTTIQPSSQILQPARFIERASRQERRAMEDRGGGGGAEKPPWESSASESSGGKPPWETATSGSSSGKPPWER